MSNPFLGEIKLVSWNLAPRGWAFCNGQILAISQNTALYSLIGTMYGGDGVTTFALPDKLNDGNLPTADRARLGALLSWAELRNPQENVRAGRDPLR